ncbi:lysine-specific demethylase 7A isoform X2 [Nematostella vectensis]|uniref:lysine-specific demethylase 7A isoform X2 n=1 Tax=Nematostella vectensis TaxID=45351 RepID=UPI002076F3A9|nr:lysine-specific demethylase 7A isoform X2 [Nematostella vectensis]
MGKRNRPSDGTLWMQERLSTHYSTAFPKADYISVTDVPITFKAGVQKMVINITLVDDEYFENVTKHFDVSLSTAQPTVFTGPLMTIFLVDDDVKRALKKGSSGRMSAKKAEELIKKYDMLEKLVIAGLALTVLVIISFGIKSAWCDVTWSPKAKMADHQEQYCICRRPYEPEEFMIQCDSCQDWFHGSCVGIEEYQASDIERYHCPSCAELYGPLTLKKRRNWHRHDYSELDDGSKAIQTGTVLFINTLKTKKFGSPKESVIEVHGRDLTVDYFERNGFQKPLLIDKTDGLNIVVPKPGFDIPDVEKYVGSMRELDVIDVCKQEDIKMRMREWTEYYMNPVRKKTLNVISLEFSNTPMSSLVHVPAIVKELDWANHVWPTDLPEDSPHKKPYVQKYCLMSVSNCYTDFHVDFGGTSVWYHVFKGEKVFYFVEPTPANLEKYHQWVMSSTQSEIFFGDMVKKCYKVQIKQGQTLFIPTGWIHAVYTPVDSLVFGGNFLHSFNIGLQLEIYDLELKLKTPNKFQHPFYETINWFAAVFLLDKLKGIQEIGGRPPQYLVKGMQDLVEYLKKWTVKGDAYVKHHKFYIPEGIQPGKLIRSINKELKKAEKSRYSRPSTPKVEDLKRQQGSPQMTVAVDSTKTKIKIKTKKHDTKPGPSKKDQNSNEEMDYSCELDVSNPVSLTKSNPNSSQRDALTPGESLEQWRRESMSASLPSIKLKLPKRQESFENTEKKRLSSSAAESALKIKVSNGKIVSNPNHSGQMGVNREFQSLTGDDRAQYSCSPSADQQPLKLKLSMSGYNTHNPLPLLPNDSDLDLSDDELGFSLGGTPQLPSTQGSLGTTHGLQATEHKARPNQPVASMETSTSDRDLKAEIEAAKTLLFGFSGLQGSDIKKPTTQTTRSRADSLIAKGPQKSRLNSSKRTYSDTESDDDDEKDDDLGFGDSDYFKDTKYGKVACSPSKETRPHRQSSRRLASQQESQQSLLNAPLPSSSKSISPTLSGSGPLGQPDGSAGQSSSSGNTSKGAAAATTQAKRGRHKTVTTTKQRLAKILKLDKSGRYMR